MLEVAVHHRDDGCCGRQNALDHRRRQAAPADALDDADMARFAGNAAHQFARPVGGIVIDEKDFPAAPGEHHRQFRDQLLDIGGFVERRHDHRDIERQRIDRQRRIGNQYVVAHETSVLSGFRVRGWSRPGPNDLG